MGGTNVGVCSSCCFFVFNVRRSRDLSTQLERLRFPPKMGGAAFSKLINGFSLPTTTGKGERGGKVSQERKGTIHQSVTSGTEKEPNAL